MTTEKLNKASKLSRLIEELEQSLNIKTVRFYGGCGYTPLKDTVEFEDEMQALVKDRLTQKITTLKKQFAKL